LAQPKLKIQISSPVEEQTLIELKDVATFTQVETDQAMLTVTLLDASNDHQEKDANTVGISTSYDLVSALGLTINDDEATPTSFLPSTPPYVRTLDVTISVHDHSPDVLIALLLTLEPSKSSIRADCFHRLNLMVQKRSAVVLELRQLALTEARETSSTTSLSSGGTENNEGTITRAGFLKNPTNNTTPEKVQTIWNGILSFYDVYFGPQSLIRNVAPIMQNYVFFALAVSWMHYRGQTLALPKPV
jgi:hypothetical protein